LTLKATEELINVLIKIIFEIYLIVFDKHFEFKPIHERKTVRKIIADILVKQESDKNKAVVKFIKNANKKKL
jgi:hypothetical protein